MRRGGIFTKKRLTVVRRKVEVGNQHKSLSSSKSITIREMRLAENTEGCVGDSVLLSGILVVVL